MVAQERGGNLTLRHAVMRGLVAMIALLVVACVFAGQVLAQANPPLYLVDSQFTGLQTLIFLVDPATGALEVRGGLGTTYTPALGMAAASRTVLFLSATDTGPSNLCQGNVGCLLLRVELDPLSTTPALVQVVGTITEGGSMLAGITGLTFRNDGNLYAVSQDTDGLYILDPATAVATRIATVDMDLHGGDITFDGSDRLFLWTNDGPGTGLYLIDPVTAHASVFDLHPYLNMGGLAAIGHGDVLRAASTTDSQLYEVDPLIGLTGITFPLTLDGVPFAHKRGDMDSPFCESDEDCADDDPCTSDECSPGGCRHSPAQDGTECDDGDACTLTDTCQAGTCTGANPLVCVAPDACHDPGTCNPTSGICENAPAKPDDTPCDDGNLCTVGEACLVGACIGGSPPDLDGDAHVDGRCGGNDCSDANPFVWFAPIEVTNLTVSEASPASLSWDSQNSLVGPETTYDLVSGSLMGDAGFSFLPSACLQTGLGTTYSDIRPDPAPEQGFWYLARGTNSCGVGTLGSTERDTIIGLCP